MKLDIKKEESISDEMDKEKEIRFNSGKLQYSDLFSSFQSKNQISDEKVRKIKEQKDKALIKIPVSKLITKKDEIISS